MLLIRPKHLNLFSRAVVFQVFYKKGRAESRREYPLRGVEIEQPLGRSPIINDLPYGNGTRRAQGAGSSVANFQLRAHFPLISWMKFGTGTT